MSNKPTINKFLLNCISNLGETPLQAFKTAIRILIVGIIWSIFFFEGIRVILLTNWHFDLIDSRHWRYVWDLWMGGWVIDDKKEWSFLLILFSIIPLWLTGWASLSMIKWEELWNKALPYLKKFYKIVFPDHKEEQKKEPTVALKPTVKRKKSYKEIRPRNLSSNLPAQPEQNVVSSPIAANRTLPNVKPITVPTPTTSSILDHSLFKMEDSDNDFDLNFDDLDKIGSTPEKPSQPAEQPQSESRRNDRRQDREKRESRQRDNNRDNRRNNKPLPMSGQPQAPKNSGNSSLEVIKQKGYQVITSATIKNNFVDFIGVADGQICICMVDKESGDWLADEERFNDEEPLWFSESSHRISPVRCADIVQQYLTEKLKENGFDYAISTYVIEQYGNIINAEDMFDTWKELNINVTRIDRGMPRELKLFAKTLEDADKSIDIERFEKIKKIVRNLT